MTSMWIGPDETLTEGQIGFLVRKSHETNGSVRFVLRDIPAYTNQSNEPRLHGWCGTDNNLATSACGMARVTRLARNGRALVTQLLGDELKSALDELGYPELMSES